MLTFRVLSDLFLKDKQTFADGGVIDPKTVAWLRSGLKPLLEKLGDEPAATIAAYHVTGVRFKPNAMQAARALFRWAVKQRLVSANPLDGTIQPRYEGRERMPTEVEFRMIRRTIAPRYRWLLWVMRRCGARPGELRNARWSDFLEGDSTIVLTTFKAKKLRKDKLRQRCIFLDPVTVRVLAWLRRARGANDADPIFPGADGKPIKKDSLCREFRRTTKKLRLNVGRNDRLVCYSIRHGWATVALAKGCHIKEVSEMLGHTTIAMTERYVHNSRDNLRQAAANATRKPKPEEIKARPILGSIEGFPRILQVA